ncbi:MAG: hypothetical protein ABI454_03500 [Sphingomicrobium sp.]
MKGGLRLGVAVFTAGLALGPAPIAAQGAPAAATNTPAGESVGPKELQNFSLSGTVTRPPDQPAQRTTTTAAPERRPDADTRTSRPTELRRTPAPTIPAAQGTAESAQGKALGNPAQSAPPATEPPRQTSPSSSITIALPPLSPAAGGTNSAAALPAASGVNDAEGATGTLGPESGLPLWPWLLAALALGAGGAFLFWRNRAREAFAGGAQFDVFSAPEPTPAPSPQPRAPQPTAAPPSSRAPQTAPAPIPPRPSPAIPGGVISTGLRPSIEIGLQPLRCIVDEARVTFEFEIDLFNAGNAPARGVLVEASMFNAGPTQENDIGAFFARPAGEGERIAAIPPLQRMTLRSQVVAPRDNVQVLEIGERQVCIPLIAFNALYRWSAGEGQTSAAYLLGRDTKGKKMAPFRLDLGPRVFRAVGARLLPNEVRN